MILARALNRRQEGSIFSPLCLLIRFLTPVMLQRASIWRTSRPLPLFHVRNRPRLLSPCWALPASCSSNDAATAGETVAEKTATKSALLSIPLQQGTRVECHWDVDRGTGVLDVG